MVTVDRDSVNERYRLDVMATKIVDVICCAGGWLFDRAMEGWDVTVLAAGHRDDVRPLQILGAKAADLESALAGPERAPAALSVAADLYATDERVRRAVRKAFNRGTPEITVWGQHRPMEHSRSVVAVRHQLSSAASVYKVHALTAAGLPVDSVDPIEMLGRLRRNPRVAQDSRFERHHGETVSKETWDVLMPGIMTRG